MAEITVADELQKADELRERGVISQQEFDAFTARLLASVPVAVSGAVETPPTGAPLPPPPPPHSTGAPPQLLPLAPTPSPPTEAPPFRSVTAPRSRRLLIAGIGVVVIALVVTFVAVVGHGGTSMPPLKGTPRQIVLASATRTAAANTVHMTVTMGFSGTPSFAGHKGTPVSVSVSGEGTLDFAHKSSTLTVRGPAASGKGTEVRQMRIIGPTMYLNAPGLTGADGGKPWVQVGLAQYDQKEGTSGLGSLSTGDLSQILGVLRQHSSSVTKLGSATIDGVATTHYRAMLTGTYTSTSSSGAPVSGTASWPVDVWVDGQGRLSQLRLQLPFFGIEMSNTVTLSDYGSPVSVTPPPADQTANGTGLLNSGELDQVLGNSSGGSSSSATGSGTTAPTTAGGTSAMSDVTITQCQVDANDSTLADVGGTIVNHDTQTDDYFIHVTLLEGSTPVGGGADDENAIPPGQTSDWSTYGSVTPGSGSNLTCQLDEVDRTPSS
jgi:hypothetical protein